MSLRTKVIVVIVAHLLASPLVAAQEMKAVDKPAPHDYCTAAIENLTVDRTRVEREAMDALAATIEERRKALEATIATLKEWVGQRNAFRNQARDHVVQLYARMSSEAASTQMAMMDPQTASAILLRMDPRAASAILSEMEASQAARLSAMLATVAELKVPREARP